MKTTKQEKDNTVYATVTRVSSSGMSRRIKFYTIKNDELYYLTYNIGVLLGENVNNDGLLAKGCGMDMIFDTLYNANYVAFRLENGNDAKQSADSCNSYLFNTNYNSLQNTLDRWRCFYCRHLLSGYF